MPAEAFPVSVLVREEMDVRDWSVGDVLQSAGTTTDTERCLLEMILWCDDPDVLLGEGGAEFLSRAFGISVECWLENDRVWREWELARRARIDAAEARIAELKAERSQRLASAYDSALPGDVLVSAELWNAVKANVERLQGENAALLADKARLDWLSRNPPNNERLMKPMTSLSREQIDGAIRDAVRSAPGGETP
jgi:hypothetical protein